MENIEKRNSFNWLLKLKAIYNSLKTAEKNAAEHLLKHSNLLSGMTITEASKFIGCSQATLFRLSKKLGFNGYPELRQAFKLNRDSKEFYLYTDIKQDDSSEKILNKVFSTTIHTIQNTLDVVNLSEYDKALNAILNANKISFFAIGGASSVAMIGFYKFNRIGCNCTYYTDPDLSLIAASHLKKQDVSILISHSGKSKPVINAAKLSKDSGATSISITNFPLSPLAKISDIILLTAAFAEYSSRDILANRVAQLCLIESLYIGVFNILHKNKDELLSNVNKIDDIIKLNKV
ncbi:MAG TPA: MurR/RpiR family transcriptional regulator [Spirochaetes bacterium]|nr:MurR/RpiR family transcriptional regulator [Spirochaetota bacterium]